MRRAKLSCFAAALSVSAVPTGCTVRRALSAEDLRRVLVLDAPAAVVVYPDSRAKATRSDGSSTVLHRKRAGRIVDYQCVNGVDHLYISFDPGCSDQDCAFRFVTSGDSFELASPPAHVTLTRAKRNPLRLDVIVFSPQDTDRVEIGR